MPEAPNTTFELGWKSGDWDTRARQQRGAQEARARQQREQSYLQDVLARARAQEQDARAATQAEFWGSPDDGPDMLAFADRIDETTQRPVYKSLGGYQNAQKVATTRRERTDKVTEGKRVGQSSRARYAPGGDLAGQPIPAEVERRITALESGNLGPGWDKDFEEMRQFGQPDWNKTPEERQAIADKRRLGKAQADKGVLDVEHFDRAGRETRDETARRNRADEAHKARALGLKEQALQQKESALGGGKPIPAEAAKLTMAVAELGDTTATIDGLLANPNSWKILESYIGPYAHRKIAAQTYAPGGRLGAVPTEVVEMQQALATLKNSVINLRTGAAMSELEANRIFKEIPDLNLPPDQFRTRYARARQMVERRRQIIKDALLPGGDRQALLRDSPPLGQPALPPPLSLPSSGGWGPAQRIK